jgi:metallo-beta-lactamase family protein
MERDGAALSGTIIISYSAMKISFHVAARTVTGSKHLLTLDNGTKVLLDCGMFQGLGKETMILNKDWGFVPAEVDHVILSHAHIDHVGLMPKLVKEGFKGKIFCTSATADLARILMQDSARIQEGDIRYINKVRASEGRELVEALYTVEDASAAADLFVFTEYGDTISVTDDIQLTFTDAGHLLGSCVVNLKVQEHGNETRITFSGDIGRYNDVILRSPATFPQADYVIMESTYGDTLHGLPKPAALDLLEWIQRTCIEKGGKLVIPAFSVGRTQEILYQLNRLELEHRLPDLKYYVDSPLSIDATEVIKKHPECYNESVEQVMRSDDDVFQFKGLHYIRSSEESISLNDMKEPCVIISASGMAEAGRVKHHIAHNIGDRRNTILLVGYCEPNSLGGKLKAGAPEVSIFGKVFSVTAEVGSISSMSAHGDYDDLCQWLSCQDADVLRKVFLVHGEYDVQVSFRERLIRKNYRHVEIPAQHTEAVL